MKKPLGNPFISFNEDSKKFEPYASIGFNNLLLNTDFSYPGDRTKYFSGSNITVEKCDYSYSGTSLRVMPFITSNIPIKSQVKSIPIDGDGIIYNDDGSFFTISDNYINRYDILDNSIINGFSLYLHRGEIAPYSTKKIFGIDPLKSNEIYIVAKIESKHMLCKYVNSSLINTCEVSQYAQALYCNGVFVYLIDGSYLKIYNMDDLSVVRIYNLDLPNNSITKMYVDLDGSVFLIKSGVLERYISDTTKYQKLYSISLESQIQSFVVDIDANVFAKTLNNRIMKIAHNGVCVSDIMVNGLNSDIFLTSDYGLILSSNGSVIRLTSNLKYIWQLPISYDERMVAIFDQNFITSNNDIYSYDESISECEVKQNITLKSSQIYTLQFKCRVTAPDVIIIGIANKQFEYIITTSDAVDIVECFEIDNTISKNNSLSIKTTYKSTFYISDLKLEEGNVPTTWSINTSDERYRQETHTDSSIFSPNGIHGLRFNAQTNQLETSQKNGVWNELKHEKEVPGMVSKDIDIMGQYLKPASGIVTGSQSSRITSINSNDIANGVSVIGMSTFNNLLFGEYSVVFRMAIGLINPNIIESDKPIIRIVSELYKNNMRVKTINNAFISISDLIKAKAIDQFASVGFNLNYSHNSYNDGSNCTDFSLVLKILPYKQNPDIDNIKHITIDYILVNLAYTPIMQLSGS